MRPQGGAADLKALARRTATVPKIVKTLANINSKYPVGFAQSAAVVGYLELAEL